MKFNVLKKSIVSLLAIGVIFLQVAAPINAEVVVSGAKWTNTVTVSGVKYLNTPVNTTYLATNWQTPGSTAVSNWTNYSGNYVKASVQNNSTSKVDCASKESGTWFSWAATDMFAITNIRDSSGVWAWNFNTGASNSLGTNFVYAQIYTNPMYNSNSALSQTSKTYVLTHEIGHTLNLGHTQSQSTASVMRTGYASYSWANYDRPQDYDRTVLVALYQTYLGR